MRIWLRKFTPDHTAVHTSRWFAPFRTTLLHPRLWHLNRRSAAGGVAVGLFCGLLPPPFQMLSAAACAVVFRINLPLAIVTTLYTNPLTFIPLYVFAYWLGSLIVGADGRFVPPPEFDMTHLGVWLQASIDWLGQLGLPLVVGVLLLASLFAALGYLGMRVTWRLYLLKKLSQRKAIHHRSRDIPQP